MSKTDLEKIFSASGYPGLYKYVAQANAGIILESLSTGKRSSFSTSSKLSALSDIAIFTEEGEISLMDLLLKMKEAIVSETISLPSPKPIELKLFFEKVLPNYDRERFYISHMKKVVEWYSNLEKFASLDFVDPNEQSDEGERE
ncbi:MAG: DUF5606 domain-containing protein [Bacteroidales bacterium]